MTTPPPESRMESRPEAVLRSLVDAAPDAIIIID
jgi:hypothetical protein